MVSLMYTAMSEVGTLVQYVSVLIISEIGLKVHAACNPPPPVAGTRHSGTLAVYQSGDVLYFSCDTGYNPNYNPPTSTCLDSGAWNPSEVACELDVVSLVVAIVVAISACVIFAVCVALFRRKKRCHRITLSTTSPNVNRRSPMFPEYPPETVEISRPRSLSHSVQIDGNTGETSDSYDQIDNYDALVGLSEIREQGDETTGGLQNPGLVDDEGVDVVDAGGLEMTDAISAGSSTSPDYENREIMGKELGVTNHSYENTSLPKNIVVGSDQSPDYENAVIMGKELGVTSHSYENTSLPKNIAAGSSRSPDYENAVIMGKKLPKNIAAGSSRSPDYENAVIVGKETGMTSYSHSNYENTAL